MKKTLLALMLASSLAACSVVDSGSMNAQAAQQYSAAMSKARASNVVDTTSNTAKRVQRVFQRMLPAANAANMTGQPFAWEMTVIRSDELNAWAMPGGKMAMYTGIVEKLNLTDDEIAAIVGHEMTHALLEHSKKEANRNVGLQIGATLGNAILSSYTGVDTSSLVGLAADLGVDKPFSRSAEKEADLGGLKLMAQSGYNPQAAITVWTKMNQFSNNNDVVSGILSTHPTNNARIKLIQDELPNVMPIYQKAKK
ncbi:M48 family metallopeptidase [Alysiella crassa]|uniref:Uncharacterized metalloprotease yggG n=1 Tax=Alysiella crassa TaxID=153491 RepID=A0A376BU27_9NEIS|nr:M48 family metallopeptidase [Alysiella crassa]UOP05926.1 M48 family metallopeptidase [Alysiella crassa]SSY80351.1 Uncharacterized metalloprotease yggG [Alysiella crassa]